MDDKLVYRVARMTRMLRSSMKELDLDTRVVKVSEMIPDARERLSYVAGMTEQAAEKTLNATEEIRPLQSEIKKSAIELRKTLDPESQKDIDKCLEMMAENAGKTQSKLMDIVMAQDYQDLTGQVLIRLMDVVHELENELVAILLEHVDEVRAKEIRERLASDAVAGEETGQMLHGPEISSVINDEPAGEDDVDSLLAELDL